MRYLRFHLVVKLYSLMLVLSRVERLLLLRSINVRQGHLRRFWGKIEGLQKASNSRNEIVISKRPWRRRVSEERHSVPVVPVPIRKIST